MYAVKMSLTGKLGTLDRIRSIAFTQIRKLVKDIPLPEEGGIKYHGFTYYPRSPDFKDPPYEPTKLFLVKRLCKMHSLNPVEKKTLQKLNIDGKVSLKQHITITKNTPEINAMLWKVKHLVKITPIRFVNGLPKDGDTKGTYLRDNGEFIVSEKLKIDDEKMKISEKLANSKNVLDGNYLKNYLRLRWDKGFHGDM